MSAFVKTIVKELKKTFRSLGFDIVSSKRNKLSNRDMIDHDICVVVNTNSPVIFDVGANKGQSIELYSRLFTDATIYSFEPNPGLYKTLAERFKDNHKVHVSPVALGETDGSNEFIVFENNELSSFKHMEVNTFNPFSGEKIDSKPVVEITTLDSYVQKNAIPGITLLKIDTQGYELEILKGSIQRLSAGVIQHIYLEICLVPLYKGQSNYIDIFRLLQQYGYQLVGIYEMRRYNNFIEWANALFTLVPHMQQEAGK